VSPTTTADQAASILWVVFLTDHRNTNCIFVVLHRPCNYASTYSARHTCHRSLVRILFRHFILLHTYHHLHQLYIALAWHPRQLPDQTVIWLRQYVSNTPIQAYANLTLKTRTTRFPEFGASTTRHNSDDRVPQSSTLSQPFGNGGAWQASSDIWGKNTIGSGLANNKRDASQSRGKLILCEARWEQADFAVPGLSKDSYTEKPSGSGALTASSEVDWPARTNPWQMPDTTSPTMQSSHSGSTSPTHTRGGITNSSQTILDFQNQFQQSRPSIGNINSSRPGIKSSLDPSSGSFYVQKPSFGYQEMDKENGFNNNGDNYDVDQSPNRYLPIGGVSRDGSMPPSRASETALNGHNAPFGNGRPTFGSIGHTPSSSSHSQRQSVSDGSGQYSGSRFELPQSDNALNEKFARFNLSREQNGVSQAQTAYNPQSASYSPHNPNFPPSYAQANSQEPYAIQPFADQGYFKPPRFNDRGNHPPATNDARRGVNSPKFYSGAGTPVSVQEQNGVRPGSGPRMPQASDFNRQIQQNLHLVQQHAVQQAYLFQAQQAQFPNQFAPLFDFNAPQFRPAYPYQLQMNPFPAAQVIPTRPAKDQDSGVGIRSALLEDFRSNGKTSKRYELKDIYNHVVEFSGDQHGSRFIQGKLETANSDEKEQIFREVQTNPLQLMTDVFGNYVIQKMFEHGNQVQKRLLGNCMKNHIVELSLQMYGCRVVQKVCIRRHFLQAHDNYGRVDLTYPTH